MKTKQKKSIGEMSAEEFMRYGFDSDEEEETGNEEKEKHLKLRSNKKTKNLKRYVEHKCHLKIMYME